MTRTTRSVGRALTVAAATVSATAALSLAPAGADPLHAHQATRGTADCGSAGMFTFVVTGNSGQGTAWNGAFVTSSTGKRAIFHPRSFDLVFSTPQGDFTQQVSKSTAPGPVSCTISATPFPGATLTGMVTGALTWRG